jgi:hypothetical protein
VRLLGDGPQVDQDPLERTDELAPGRRQRHRSVVAIEQPDSKRRFELADLDGQRGLRHVQVGGRAREVAAPRHRQERLDMADVGDHSFFRILGFK